MIRKAIDRALELPAVYNLNQFFGQSTVRRYRTLLAEEVPCDTDTSLLDLGCGTGVTAGVVIGRYSGVDINPDYVDTARRRYPHAEFFAMDCSKLGFPDASFDLATTIATTHHLTDAELESMTLEALRVVRPGGRFTSSMPFCRSIAGRSQRSSSFEWIAAGFRGNSTSSRAWCRVAPMSFIGVS